MNTRRLFARFSPFLLLLLGLSLQSCLKDSCEGVRTFVEYEPVWMLPEALHTITIEEPRPLERSGKIYVYQDLLFINEPHEGIHIFDNSDATNPQALHFLSIPGNVDLAIRNDMLYADNGPDLLTFSLARPDRPELLTRVAGVFQHFYTESNLGVLLYFEPTERTVEVPCNDPRWEDDGIWLDGEVFRVEALNAPVQNALPAAQVGTGGSLARFTILDNWLYTVDETSLQVFSLVNEQEPSHTNQVQIGWGIETIFPHGNNLFLGANNGMYIFDASDRQNPRMLSVFQHAQACDPVFVQGDRAYVTLRDGTTCQNFINQLDVVDISDLENPSLIQTFPMHHPIGLSVVDDWLYLCEDDLGLKVFDKEPLANIADGPELVLSGLSAIDIIALPNRDLAIVIGTDGLHQYDISDRANPDFLSLIPVNQQP